MININSGQKEILNEYMPNAQELLDKDEINDLLDALDDLITDVGFDKNWELNELGLKLQLLYDQLYNQND